MRSQSSAQPRFRFRLLLLAVAIAALATACAQLARADDSPPPSGGVTIAPSDGTEPRSLTAADMAALQDVHDAIYTLRAADGTTSTTTVRAGTSVGTLLRAAGLDGDPYTYIEIAGDDDSIALLQQDDLGGADEGPPVVWSDEQGVHFLRPSKDEQDANAGELVTASGGPLALTLRTGTFVKPRIAASTLRGRPSQRIDFNASLATGTLLPGMRYRWYFDGSGNVFGTDVTHRFPQVGSWVVLLNVVRGQVTVGLPARVRVRIAPRQNEQRTDDGGRPQGDGNGGTSTGATGGGSGAAGGRSGGTGGSGGNGAVGPGTLPDTALPPPAPAPPPPPVAPPAPAPQPPRDPAPPRSAAATPKPQGELVSGTLIASTQAVPVLGDAARGGSPPRGAASDGPLHIPVGVWFAIGLAALLALGWTLESRHPLPFWQP